MKVIFLFLIVFCVVFSEADVIPECRELFKTTDYPAAVECLNHELYTTPFADTLRLISIYESLGVGYMMQDKKKMARAAFEQLVRLQADYDLDPNAYLPEIIALFQSVKLAYKKDSLHPSPAVKKTSPWPLYFLPLGAPQFAGRKPIKGSVMLGLQALSLGLSIYAYNRKHSLYSETYHYAESDVQTARRYDTLYKVTFLTFTATYGYSIFDGFLTHAKGK